MSESISTVLVGLIGMPQPKHASSPAQQRIAAARAIRAVLAKANKELSATHAVASQHINGYDADGNPLASGIYALRRNQQAVSGQLIIKRVMHKNNQLLVEIAWNARTILTPDIISSIKNTLIMSDYDILDLQSFEAKEYVHEVGEPQPYIVEQFTFTNRQTKQILRASEGKQRLSKKVAAAAAKKMILKQLIADCAWTDRIGESLDDLEMAKQLTMLSADTSVKVINLSRYHATIDDLSMCVASLIVQVPFEFSSDIFALGSCRTIGSGWARSAS